MVVYSTINAKRSVGIPDVRKVVYKLRDSLDNCIQMLALFSWVGDIIHPIAHCHLNGIEYVLNGSIHWVVGRTEASSVSGLW